MHLGDVEDGIPYQGDLIVDSGQRRDGQIVWFAVKQH
jgi:hypothetical protein